jgi:hypothetical protein
MSGGSRRPAPNGRGRLARVVVLRGVLLILIGVLLTFLETPIAIILDTYGFLFLVALPLLYCPRWLLGVVAAAAAVAGPWVVQQVLIAIEGSTGATATAFESPWAYFPVRWLTDAYPAPVWLAYIAVGILIARSDLRRRGTQYALVAIGGVAAVLGYTVADALGPPVLAHDDSTAEVIASGGLAVALVGAFVWLTESTAERVRRTARRVLWPVGAVGSMPLTVYTAQIIVIFVIVETVPYTGGYLGWQTVPLFFALAVPSIAVAFLWRLRFAQGPLEWLLSRLTTQRPWPRRRPVSAAH